MRRPRPRNKSLEEYVAKRQGLYLHKSPEEMMRLIDQKSGDYYKFDLYPDQKIIADAEADFSTFRTGTPAMEQVADDMRRYYGLTSPPPLPTSSPAVASTLVPVVTLPPTTASSSPALATALPPAVSKTLEEMDDRGAQIKAQNLRDEYVNDISDNVSKKIDQALEELKPKGFLLDDPLADTALWAGAALAAGAGGTAAIMGNDEDKRLKEAIENGYILN